MMLTVSNNLAEQAQSILHLGENYPLSLHEGQQ